MRAQCGRSQVQHCTQAGCCPEHPKLVAWFSIQLGGVGEREAWEGGGVTRCRAGPAAHPCCVTSGAHVNLSLPSPGLIRQHHGACPVLRVLPESGGLIVVTLHPVGSAGPGSNLCRLRWRAPPGRPLVSLSVFSVTCCSVSGMLSEFSTFSL